MQRGRDDLNKKWGDLANSRGFIVEGLIIPNIEPLIKRVFQEDIEEVYQRTKKKIPGTYTKKE